MNNASPSPEYVQSKVINARFHILELEKICPKLGQTARVIDEMVAIAGNHAIIDSLCKKREDEAQTLAEVAILEHICGMCDLPKAA